jgi:integrase/recombinase XerC
MLRPEEAAFEKMLAGFAEHQRARRLSVDIVKERERIVRQVRAFADAYPWEPAWNRALFDRWSAMLAQAKAASTMSSYQLHLRHFLTYITDPAYEWPQVCLELFGSFPANAVRDLNSVRHSQEYMGGRAGTAR